MIIVKYKRNKNWDLENTYDVFINDKLEYNCYRDYNFDFSLWYYKEINENDSEYKNVGLYTKKELTEYLIELKTELIK